MAIIKPFRLLHYNGSRTEYLQQLIAPPYDVISPEQQDKLYQAHELNVIRLVLGKRYSADTDTDNRYTRAASTLNEWMDEGVLVLAERPGLTLYQMEFERPD